MIRKRQGYKNRFLEDGGCINGMPQRLATEGQSNLKAHRHKVVIKRTMLSKSGTEKADDATEIRNFKVDPIAKWM